MKRKKRSLCTNGSSTVESRGIDEEGHSHSKKCSQDHGDKSKKRRLSSNESCIAENNGLAKEDQAYGFCPRDHDKFHIRTIFDELETYLAPSPPEIHRLRIPSAAGAERREDFLGVDDGTALNPKPCDAAWEGLRLSPEGLKEPRQDFVEGFERLLEMKFGIMALRIRHGLDAWSLGSHMVNPFEVLSFVAAASTLNRAFFKMWELIQTFELVPSVSKNRRFLSAHLCEGPGGFIEAVLEYRARSSSIPEESHEEDNCEGIDHDELHRSDSSPLSAGIGAHQTSDHPPPLKVNNGSGGFCCRSTVSDTSGAISGPETCESAELDNEIGSCPKAGSRRSPSVAPEGSGAVEVRSPMSTSGSSLANQLNDNGSSVHSSVQVNDFLDCDLDRLDSRDLEGSFGKTSLQYHDLWFGQTLVPTQQSATGGPPPPMLEMRRLNEKGGRRNSSQGHLHFGVDGSGDLTNPANMNAFVEYTLGQSDGQRIDLITADGAFDVSEDFSSQEHSHLNLVFCEVVSALRLQAEGGSFVLKLFDCYTASSLTILFILSSLYRNVEIVRLRTTRVCNSERYVVAEGFLGLSSQLEKILLRLNLEWSIAAMRGEKVGILLSGGFPERLLQAVMESNTAIAAVQVDAINRALQLAELVGERLPNADSFGKRKGSISMLRRKLQSHKRMQRNAVALCNALNIPCKSQFCIEE